MILVQLLKKKQKSEVVEVPVSPPVARQDTAQREEAPVARAPRKSTRPKKKPNWMGTGEFAMAVTPDIPDWEKRVNVLQSLLLTAPESVNANIYNAMVSIISSQT